LRQASREWRSSPDSWRRNRARLIYFLFAKERRLMAFDPNRMAPSGRTYAQIDAAQSEYVRAANAILASTRDKGACWSSYWASHSTFEMLVGEPYAEDNLVLSLPACEYVAGPVQWPAQQIEVVWRCDRERSTRAWEFEIRDEVAGFRAVGLVFRWRRGHDLWAQGGLWFGRGTGPETPLNCEQAEGSVAKLLRHFYNGRMGHNDLTCEVSRILEQLPVLWGRPGVAGKSPSE
jgi:hypothetical protein